MDKLHAQDMPDTSKMLTKLELYKKLEKKLPALWRIASRKDKPQEYYAIYKEDVWVALRGTKDAEIMESNQQKTYRKEDARRYDILIEFEPTSYVPSSTTSVNTGTVRKVIHEVEAKKEDELEKQYGVASLQFDIDTRTYVALTNEERDKLSRFLLAKEFYTQGGTPAPIATVANDATAYYVKGYRVKMSRLCPPEEYVVFPKDAHKQADGIEEMIKKLLTMY